LIALLPCVPQMAFKYYVAKALDKSTPKTKDDLAFKKGDLILVVEEVPRESKLKGEVIKDGKVKGDKLGWFPAFYVRRDDKEKMPELPASLKQKEPEKPAVPANIGTVPSAFGNGAKGPNLPVFQHKQPSMNLPLPASARPSNSGAGHTPPLELSLSLRTVESSGPLSPSEKESTQQKRARLQRVVPTRQLTRTLIELTNDEPEDGEEEDEEEEVDDAPVPTLSYNMTSAARSEYFASVAANMSSKMAMLAKNGRRSTGLIRGGPSLPRPGQLQPPAAPSSNTTPVRERPKPGSRESSAGPAPAQPSSARMSHDPMAANQPRAPAAVLATVTISEAPAPANVRKAATVTLQAQEAEDQRARSGSAPPPRLPLTESPATPISMGRRTGRNARAIIVVEEDTTPAPVAQSAEVKAFNPEGKKIEIIGEVECFLALAWLRYLMCFHSLARARLALCSKAPSTANSWHSSRSTSAT
jgi:hypothetical protein